MVVVILVAQSCPTLWRHGLQPARLLWPWDSPGKNTGVDCHSLLRRVFLTQGSNLGLLHCSGIFYCLSYREVPVGLDKLVDNQRYGCSQFKTDRQKRHGPNEFWFRPFKTISLGRYDCYLTLFHACSYIPMDFHCPGFGSSCLWLL